VLDLKRIREDPDGVSAALARRDVSLAAVVGEVLDADREWRAATTSAESLRAEQKARSEEFGAAKSRGEVARRGRARAARRDAGA
jgi:seryl-tRNA synthetase